MVCSHNELYRCSGCSSTRPYSSSPVRIVACFSFLSQIEVERQSVLYTRSHGLILLVPCPGALFYTLTTGFKSIVWGTDSKMLSLETQFSPIMIKFVTAHWAILVFVVPLVFSLSALIFFLVFDKEQKACQNGALCIILSCLAGLLSILFLSPHLGTALVWSFLVFAIWMTMPLKKSKPPSHFT